MAMQHISAVVGSGKYIVEAISVFCGEDLNITIGGGEQYHVGAVAIAVPGNKLESGITRSATTSVICLQDHKDDQLAHYAAKHLATILKCIVTVTVGIHVDDANAEDIEILILNCKELVTKLEQLLLEHSTTRRSINGEKEVTTK